MRAAYILLALGLALPARAETLLPMNDEAQHWIAGARRALDQAAEYRAKAVAARERPKGEVEAVELLVAADELVDRTFRRLVASLAELEPDAMAHGLARARPAEGALGNARAAVLATILDLQRALPAPARAVAERRADEFLAAHAKELDSDDAFVERLYPYLYSRAVFEAFDVVATDLVARKTAADAIRATRLFEDALAFSARAAEPAARKRVAAKLARTYAALGWTGRLARLGMPLEGPPPAAVPLGVARFAGEMRSRGGVQQIGNVLLQVLHARAARGAIGTGDEVGWDHYHVVADILAVAGRVYFVTEDEEMGTLGLTCVDRESGRLVLQQPVGAIAFEKTGAGYGWRRTATDRLTLVFDEGEIRLSTARGVFVFDALGRIAGLRPTTPADGVAPAPARPDGFEVTPRACVEDLLRDFARGPIDERVQIGRLLARIAPAQAVPTFAAALRDPEYCIRRVAQDGLVTAGPAAVPHVAPLLRDRDVEVRVTAVQTLARLGPTAAPALRAAIADPEPEVRTQAEYALEGLGAGR